MSMYNLAQLISAPTRITTYTSSVIDLIFVSDPNKISQSGVGDVCTSDHQLIYCTHKLTQTPIHEHKWMKIRSFKNYSKNILETKLGEVDWSMVINKENVEDAWKLFKSTFIKVIDSVAPLKTVRVKQGSEPWVTGEILQCIRDRTKIFRKFKRTKEPSLYSKYVELRNRVQPLKNKAKAEYYIQKVKDNKNKPRNLWQILKSLGTSSKIKNNSSNIGLLINNDICFDKIKVADTFNNFFTNIASNLVDRLPASTGNYGIGHFSDYYNHLNESSELFDLQQVTVEHVSEILSGLNSSKATGLDNIPARFVKDGSKCIAYPLAHIFNLSLRSGIIPQDLKSARVTPLHKKNSKTEAGNYRPVSVLCIISKVLEKIVFLQIDKYLKEKNVLYEHQSGFRSSHSTETCLIHLMDWIRMKSDKGNFVGMVLLDLQKAFDTVNHQILLQKLQAIGVNNSSLQWFQGYLSGRTRLVDIAGTYSSLKAVTCGVPQGSILGPLLFSIYVNDLPSVVACKVLLYADDTALLVSGTDIHEIEQTLATELKCVRDWLIDNKLSLHLGKTESILFGSKQKLNKQGHVNLNITCAGNIIQSKSQVKYLGVN